MEVAIKQLKYSVDEGDNWLKEWSKKTGDTIEYHPLYLALRGDRFPLFNWCNARKDIFLMQRLDLLLDVYKSLIRYGQVLPIKITKDGMVVTGHKRACCMLAMGKEKINAQIYE